MNRSPVRLTVVVSLVAVVAVTAATVLTVRTGRLEAEVARWASAKQQEIAEERNRYRPGAVVDEIPLPGGEAVRFPGEPTILFFANPHTLSGTRDILMLERYAEHFGEALRMVWVAATEEAAGVWNQHHREAAIEWTVDTGGQLREQYSGVSLIIAGDGGIEQAFTSPTRRETRLYLNKLIPENPFVWEERPLETAVDVTELYFYRPDGTPVTSHATAVVFLSPYCGGCEEWLEAGNLEDLSGPVLVAFPMMSYEAGVQKYAEYLDGRGDIEAVVQLDLSPFAVRYPAVIDLTAAGR